MHGKGVYIGQMKQYMKENLRIIKDMDMVN